MGVGAVERGVDTLPVRGLEIKRRQNSAVHRNQMRSELNRYRGPSGDREFLLDLGEMTMFRYAVRPRAFVAFDKEIIDFSFSARAAHAAQAVDDDLIRLDQC